MFNLAEQLSAHVEIVHQIFVFQHARHDVPHREQCVGLSVVCLKHGLMIEELEDDVHIVVVPHHHLFAFQGLIVAVVSGRSSRHLLSGCRSVHLSVGKVDEKILRHQFHVHLGTGKVCGHGADGADIVGIGDAHLYIISRSAFQIVRHIDQHHIAPFGHSSVELSSIAIEVAVGEAAFFHEILHPLVHLRHDERLSIEEQEFVFSLRVGPTHDDHLKEERTTLIGERVEPKEGVVEKHARVLSLDIGVDPSLTAIAFVLNDAIESSQFVGMTAHHAHLHLCASFGDNLACHRCRRSHLLLVRRKERALHIAPP